jgi:hypothetical protein
VSVHQVGFNFNLYKMHGEYNIKYFKVNMSYVIWKGLRLILSFVKLKKYGASKFSISLQLTIQRIIVTFHKYGTESLRLKTGTLHARMFGEWICSPSFSNRTQLSRKLLCSYPYVIR